MATHCLESFPLLKGRPSASCPRDEPQRLVRRKTERPNRARSLFPQVCQHQTNGQQEQLLLRVVPDLLLSLYLTPPSSIYVSAGVESDALLMSPAVSIANAWLLFFPLGGFEIVLRYENFEITPGHFHQRPLWSPWQRVISTLWWHIFCVCACVFSFQLSL